MCTSCRIYKIYHPNTKYTNPTPKYDILNAEHTLQNSKLSSILFHAVCRETILSRIYALFGIQFPVFKMALVYKKLQISGMPHMWRSWNINFEVLQISITS